MLQPYWKVGDPDGHLATVAELLDTGNETLRSPPSPTEKQKLEHGIQGPFILKLCENIQQQFPDVKLLEIFMVFDPSKLPFRVKQHLNAGMAKRSSTHVVSMLFPSSKWTG